jgi:predicted N-acetyltransferase YhbS
MKDSAVVVRAYEENDREGVRALLRGTFGDSLGFDRFETGNPLGPAIRAVASDGGRVVGFNQWQPWKIPGAEEISTFQSGASAVDTAYRGHRLFSRLLAEGESQANALRVGCFIGFPNPASLGAFVRSGWKVVQSLSLRCNLVPSLGSGKSGETGSLGGLAPFYRWRYESADVEARTVGSEGRVAIFRRVREGGIAVIRLLDVIGARGERSANLLSGLSTALPGMRLITFRASHALGGAPSFPVPGRWKTPFIVKRITGSAADENALERCQLLYGDIDAS